MAQAVPFALQAVGSIVQGVGESRAYGYQAAAAKKQADIARLQGTQIDGQLREELNSTISNIRAIRASAGVSADSPSARAVVDEEERVSDRQRRIEVGGRRLQAAQYEEDARMKRRSARWALGMGVVNALPAIAQAKNPPPRGL